MATIPSGKATYKKKDGIITLTADQSALTWTPLPGTGPPHVSLSVDNIKNIQQTPKTNPRVILKIVEKPKSADAEPTAYMFQFTSPTDARSEANDILSLLTDLIAGSKANDPAMPGPAGGAGQSTSNGAGTGPSTSGAISVASTVNAKVTRWFDDKMLQSDVELQRSLMDKDEDLRLAYADALATKSDSVSEATFNNLFWASRLDQLRAHAIDLNQKKGLYNVLSTIKPRVENDELKLHLNTEQVQMIFEQHPIVRRIYNENVPKMSDAQFWSQFFLSRLCKRLRGERVTDNDDTNPVFDKYSDTDSALGWTPRLTQQQIPHIVDVEANEEQDGGFKGGNRQDVEMRPRANVPIIKTLNSLSDKILVNMARSDHEMAPAAAAAGADLDNTTLDELTLHDLRGEAEADGIQLSVKEPGKYFSNQVSSGKPTEEALAYEKQVPTDVIFDVQADLETFDDDGAGGIDLHRGIGVDDDSDSDVGGAGTGIPHAHVGSRAARSAAQTQIFEGIAQNRAVTGGAGGDDEAAAMESPMGIPPDIAQRCYLTNATTTEFLKQFWMTFNAADAARAQELAYHADSLRRSEARIHALADEAEIARQHLTDQRKKDMKEIFRKTGRKTRWIPVGGGREAVLMLFESTMEALKRAGELYQATSR
ncbi:hypothetical protein QBC47DRAFT_369645 [Echria macrotheca]|uniref:BSD domain-containing protein n=1 Tax=Echria macrotheca TaxID=438768 RepID=A0AAJ0BN12_9PEZI|nr:hypothetical protein QBC47DRAFT_369645 [Echria macrotheca]